MIDGEITRYNCTWFYLKKQHICFNCGCVLEKRRREVVVHSASLEAKNYDFEVAGSYAYGNIKFITFYFGCSNCGRSYEIRELINLEREQKRKNRKSKPKKRFKWL
ncbi:MAG: hypothetical protein IJB96_03145 [Lachnospira sp.]|nr:hypothetical protein [Lachnospira sp.]